MLLGEIVIKSKKLLGLIFPLPGGFFVLTKYKKMLTLKRKHIN